MKNIKIGNPKGEQMIIHYGKVHYDCITFGSYPQSGPAGENVIPIK